MSTWLEVYKTKAELLQQCMDEPPVEDPVTLRPLQMWIPSQDSRFSQRLVVEILGWTERNNQEMHFRTYSNNNGDVVCGTSILDQSRDQLYGGTSLMGGAAQQVLGLYPRRVFSSSISGSLGRTVNLLAKPTIYTLQTVRDTRVWIPEELIEKLTALGPFIIFSDGSWTRTGSPWKHVLGTSPEFDGSVGIISISALDEWRERPV